MGKFGFSKVSRADWGLFEEKTNPGMGNFGVSQGKQSRLGCFEEKIKDWNGKTWDLVESTEQNEAFPRKNTILKWEILGSPDQTGVFPREKKEMQGQEILGFVGVDKFQVFQGKTQLTSNRHLGRTRRSTPRPAAPLHRPPPSRWLCPPSRCHLSPGCACSPPSWPKPCGRSQRDKLGSP